VSPDNVRANAAAEMDRADQSLRAATVLSKEGLFNDAVSDAYYARFHAVRALLEDAKQELAAAKELVEVVRELLRLEGWLGTE
jgi:hypothetical protein